MTQHTIPFQVTNWEQNSTTPATEENGPKMTTATVSKQYQGALEGKGVANVMMCQAEPMTLGAGYIASEIVTGTLEGRNGTFVLQHGGLSYPDGTRSTYGNVVPGSGTGELRNIAGTLEIEVKEDGSHFLILDCSFPS